MDITEQKFMEIIGGRARVQLDDQSGNKHFRDLGIDSLSSIDLLLDIEEVFQIMIPDEYLSEKIYTTPNKLWEIIQILKQENWNNEIG